MTMEELFNFNILKALGMENSPVGEKANVLRRAAGIALDRVFAKVVKELPEGKREEFLTVSSGGTEEDKKKFLEENVPNFDELFLEEVLFFKAELLAKTAGGDQ